MAGQLSTTYSSLLRLPPLPNKDLIRRRRITFYRKEKNLAITALAGSSLGKSASRLTAVSPTLTAVSFPLSTDSHGHLSLNVPMS
ncbi:hypothetical protein MtrunA17_Chr5g0407491 [Medicago truncatula]|uniref:Uncharacterized protein n=1 Tax=Medicago truncatula TaxID=3880 RepID=A0A396HPV5_MEDTR|nr:hypothetical protein MtrunA17_Chr5g0407491 [Medicago truncatula]